MDAWSVITQVVGILGTAGTIYFGIKSERLERRIRRFDWNDIATGVREVGKRALRDFDPDLILSVSGPGAILSNLLLAETGVYVPLYVGISQRLSAPKHPCRPHYRVVTKTTKWLTYIPDEVFSFKDKRLLICDDCVLSGDTLSALIAALVEQGYERRNIKAMALFVSDVAKSAEKAPEFFWAEVPDCEFYLPWGKSLGRGQ